MAIALTVSLAGCGDGQPIGEGDPAPTAQVTSLVAAQQVDQADRVEAARAQLAQLGLAEMTLEPLPALDAEGKAQGAAPKPIAESPLRVDRESPRTILEGALEALAQEDVAALARLSEGREQLNEDDASDARRRFLAPAGRTYWGKIADAVRGGAFDVDEDGRTAVVNVEVGGAAGSYRVRMRKESDGWYLDG